MQTTRSDSVPFNDAAIVLVSTSFPTSGDGSEAAGAFVLDLAEEIARNAPCRVVAPGATTSVEKFGTNLKVFRFKAPGRPLSTLKPWLPRDLVQIIKVMCAGRAATSAAVTEGPTRMILALWAFPSGHWARQVGMTEKVPYVVWTLGSDIWSLARIPLVRGAIRRVLRESKTVYSDGIRLAEDTSVLSGRKVEFLPSTRSIDRSKARSPRGSAPYRMAFLGRWHPNKGIDLLLEALEVLDTSDWEGIESFDIYGGGPLESEVHRRTAALIEAGKPLRVGGYLDKLQSEDLIGGSDWLIIPSRVESIPLIYSDALKLNTPVLSTPVGDLQRLIKQQGTGLLAPSTSVESLTALIRSALSHSAETFGPALDRSALTFDLDQVAKRLMDAPGGFS